MFNRRVKAFRPLSAGSFRITLPVVCISFLLSAAPAWAVTLLSLAQGKVELQHPASPVWAPIVKAPVSLENGDKVRTGPGSRCEITFEEGSKVELGAKAEFTLGGVDKSQASMDMKLGTLKAWVQKAAAREFKVKTPSAVCAVRGTQFLVEVALDGRTAIELYKGLLAVTDNRGNELLLHEGQRIDADPTQMRPPVTIREHRESKQEGEREGARNEVRLEMTKDEVLAAAAKELKLAEYQQGKALVDVHGDRVRIEQYILRPKPDEFKLVVLNERQDRFDYFYYLGVFNTTLPTDLSVALRQLPGCVALACPYYLKGFETGRSNLTDSLQEVAVGGHQVDVNNNGTANSNDDVSTLFDASRDAYEDVSGRPVFQTLFDKYALYSNGIIKEGWTGTNLQSYNDSNRAPTVDPILGTSLGASLIPPTVASGFPDPTQLRQEITSTYSDGTEETFIKYDNFIIDDEGRIASWGNFAGVTTGAQFRSTLLNWNYEQVITASEFKGRSIDLVVAPKILIEAGLMK